jgi:hypothetical protein
LKKFIALVVARSKEYYRDRTMLVWTFAFPFVVLLGFAYGYAGKSDPVLKVGFYPSRAAFSESLKDFLSISQIQFIDYSDEGLALGRVRRHQLDLLIQHSPAPGGSQVVYTLNPETDRASLAERLLKSSAPPGQVLERQALTGKKIRYVDWLVPGLMSMNLMFSSLFGVGYVIVRYRKNGVLKRMRATPLSAFEFLSAQVVSRMLLLLITSSLTLFGAMLLIGFRIQGSYFSLMAFIAICSTSLISIGLLVASRISSEEVADGVLNLMTWPMIFLSGIWFSLDGASPWVVAISKCLPLTHIVNGMRAILIEGQRLQSLVPEMLGLSVTAAILIAVGSAIFKWR